MNNMDEISYWVYTKRAPCLFNYDNLIKRQNEAAHSSKPKPKSVISVHEIASPKKKKRKITLLEDDCVSLSKQQNIFFDSSQPKPMLIAKSESVSDIDFNIKNSSGQIKNKKVKQQKSNQTTLQKKNKVMTSTPKVANNLRRSLRKTQNSLNNNNQINSSFDLLNCSFNNNKKFSESCLLNVAVTDRPENNKTKKLNEKQACGDQIEPKKAIIIDKAKRETKINGHFDDLSDVSGFTANYIRSTKIHASKNQRKPRKNNRNLIKETETSNHNIDKKMIVCNNKSMNTELPIQTVLNCSTDSDNIMNLVTIDQVDKSVKVNKSTSVLNLIDAKVKTKKEVIKANNKQTKNRNVSFNSKSSGNSRYQTRSKNIEQNGVVTRKSTRSTPKKDMRKNVNSSERNEDSVELCMTKTRSGRNMRLSIQPPDNSVLVISNTEVDSGETINVASADKTPKSERKKKRLPNKSVSKKRSLNRSEQTLRQDSVREKSGFLACFSDSDDEKPLKPQKFFC